MSDQPQRSGPGESLRLRGGNWERGPRRDRPAHLSPYLALPTSAPLIGRTEELEFLRSQFEAVAAGGTGRIILVAGEPGIGKTRLVRELGQSAESCGAAFAAGRYLHDGTAPYGPWRDILRRLLRTVAREGLQPALGLDTAALAPILPELAESVAEPLPTTGAWDPRQRLYDGLGALVTNLADRAPLVLFLDDLQWAPGLTLLINIAEQIASSRVFILGAFRQSEFQEQPWLVRDWAELNRLRLATSLTLRPLTQPESGALIAQYVGSPAAAQLQDPIYARTGGNPFYIEEMLRTLAEAGTLRLSPTGWEVDTAGRLLIPASMKLAIEERVRRLGEATRAALLDAAVLGQEFRFAALRQLTGFSEDNLLAVIEGALLARLLVDLSDAGEERYAFYDDQIQEILYQSLSGARRRRSHLRAGQSLERVYANHLEPHVEELARHFAEASQPAKAACYAVQAAEKNARVFHWSRAKTYYERAVEALSHLPGQDSTRRRLDVTVDLVRTAFPIDPPETNLARLRQVEALAYALYRASGAAEDQRRLATLKFWIGRIQYYRHDYRAALEAFELARGLAEESADPQLALLCISALGRVHGLQGRFGSAMPLLEQAVGSLGKPSADLEWVASAGNLVIARAAGGDYAAGLAEHRKIAAQVMASGDLRRQAICLYHRAILCLFGADPAAAREAAERCVEVSGQVGDLINVYIGLGFQAWAESRLGQTAAAAATFARSRAVASQFGGDLGYSDWFAAAQAEAAWQAGRVGAALRLAAKAVARSQAVDGLFAAGVAHRVWGEALASGDRPQVERAEDQFATSLARFEAGHARLEAARTRVAWAVLRVRVGQAQAARELLEAACVQFELAQLVEELRWARRCLEGLSGPRLRSRAGTEPTRDPPPVRLTLRELEVLRQIALGRTNQEIADQLVVSVRTIEHHIANLYGKIGARGRADASRYAFRHRLLP